MLPPLGFSSGRELLNTVLLRRSPGVDLNNRNKRSDKMKHDKLKMLRHTASHIMAQAVKRLFPDVKLAIGPATENGFYYDFDTATPLTQGDLSEIEAEMKKIIKKICR